jgi:hypothetical protein
MGSGEFNQLARWVFILFSYSCGFRAPANPMTKTKRALILLNNRNAEMRSGEGFADARKNL